MIAPGLVLTRKDQEYLLSPGLIEDQVVAANREYNIKLAEIMAKIKIKLPCQHFLNEDSFRSVSASRTHTHINEKADCLREM